MFGYAMGRPSTATDGGVVSELGDAEAMRKLEAGMWLINGTDNFRVRDAHEWGVPGGGGWSKAGRAFVKHYSVIKL
jgi:hypothetical protein